MLLSQLLNIFVSYKKKSHPLLIYQFHLTSLLVSQNYNLMIENLAPNRPTSANKRQLTVILTQWCLVRIFFRLLFQTMTTIFGHKSETVACSGKKCKMLQHRRTIRHVVKVVCGFVVLCYQTPDYRCELCVIRHLKYHLLLLIFHPI